MVFLDEMGNEMKANNNDNERKHGKDYGEWLEWTTTDAMMMDDELNNDELTWHKNNKWG